MSVRPIDSATVVLIREKANGCFDVYLMRRNEDMDFMAGAYVFPGGMVDPEDCDAALEDYSSGLGEAVMALRANEPGLPEEKARGLLFAALRETFEEAGILPAYDEEGRAVRIHGEGGRAGRFSGYRRRIHRREITLLDIAKKENIKYAVDQLAHYSHWITPETDTAKKRFDARFFIARAPEGQTAVHDNVEMIHSLWLSPRDALDMYSRGEILLMPPTFRTIEELSVFNTTGELYRSISEKKIYAIFPEFYKYKMGVVLRLPNHPHYSKPEYKQPHVPGETCRILMRKNGRLKSALFEDDEV